MLIEINLTFVNMYDKLLRN